MLHWNEHHTVYTPTENEHLNLHAAHFATGRRVIILYVKMSGNACSPQSTQKDPPGGLFLFLGGDGEGGPS